MSVLSGCLVTSSRVYVPMTSELNQQSADSRSRLSHLEVAAAEQLHAHDGEDEPEDEAHEQHVEDAGYRLDERVYHHLGKK